MPERSACLSLDAFTSRPDRLGVAVFATMGALVASRQEMGVLGFAPRSRPDAHRAGEADLSDPGRERRLQSLAPSRD